KRKAMPNQFATPLAKPSIGSTRKADVRSLVGAGLGPATILGAEMSLRAMTRPRAMTSLQARTSPRAGGSAEYSRWRQPPEPPQNEIRPGGGGGSSPRPNAGHPYNMKGILRKCPTCPELLSYAPTGLRPSAQGCACSTRATLDPPNKN